MAPAGLIPSPELQEYRIACSTVEKSKREQGNKGSLDGFRVVDLLCQRRETFFSFLDLATDQTFTVAFFLLNI